MKEFDENEIHHELYLHLLWSTIDQKPLISHAVERFLYDYLCDMALTQKCHLIGGCIFDDHIQIVLKFSPDTVLSDLIKNLKVASMLWLRTNFRELREFEWQKSEFAFTVDIDEVGELLGKIKNSKTFEQEVYSLLAQNKMEYDRLEVLT